MYDKVQPTDIVQGSLGTCYLLSSLSALARRPAFIRRLFDGPSVNPQGVNCVWLNINGIWKQIVVDNIFPTSKDGQDNFYMGSARDSDRWVNFVEKAYAKAFGSYQIVDGGFEIEALRDLTGAPYEKIQGEDFSNANKIWYKVQKADRKGYLMVTSTEGQEEREAERDDGLYSGHAYSLVGCAEVIGSDKKKYRIV